jgi:5,10-methylenetetrahydromethanopterin reductase
MADIGFGVGMDPIHPPQEVIASAQQAEALGYRTFWIADSQLLMREAYVLMAACAVNTASIIYGTGVTNPVTRHPTVVAGAFATLDELAPDRFIIGIAPGDSALRTIGQKPARLQVVEEAIVAIQQLLTGELVTFDGHGTHLKAPRSVPVYLAATGPKMLRLAGRVADGAILGFLTNAPQIQAGLKEIEKGAAEVGRSLTRFQKIGWIPCSISPDGKRARQDVKIHVARHVLHSFPTELNVEPEVIARIRAAYDYEEHMVMGARHADLVPDELVERYALVGTPTDVLLQTRTLLDTGIDHLTIVPRGDKKYILDTFAREIMSKI